jgi:hypothetical protein
LPALKNAKHELFAQLIAKGESQTRAYVAAGYAEKGARAHGARLAANGSVAARVAELQARAVERHDVTVDSLTRDLVGIREKAIASDQPAAAVSATKLLAQIHGLLIERREVRQSLVDEIPFEEREAMIRLLQGELVQRTLPTPH